MTDSRPREQLVSLASIRSFGRRIGTEFGAERVILFGSRADGTAMPDSDVDLLIVLPHRGDRIEQSVAIRLKLRPPFPVDLIIRSPEEIQNRLAMGDTFIRDILQGGKVIYDAADPVVRTGK